MIQYRKLDVLSSANQEGIFLHIRGEAKLAT
jgi:hypothetical protein